REGGPPDHILTLTLYPHAMQQANAFYSPDAHGILFGYFQAGRDDPGHNIPGQTVFTCLSHDIIVHEPTPPLFAGLAATSWSRRIQTWQRSTRPSPISPRSSAISRIAKCCSTRSSGRGAASTAQH